MPERLRIFISSPGDVGLERNLAEHVIASLDGEFGGRLRSVRWEDRAVAGHRLPSSRKSLRRRRPTLWFRFSGRGWEAVPAGEHRRAGRQPLRSGTEWEFEDAVQAFRRARHVPICSSTGGSQEPQAEPEDPHKLEQCGRPVRGAGMFVQKWFLQR